MAITGAGSWTIIILYELYIYMLIYNINIILTSQYIYVCMQKEIDSVLFLVLNKLIVWNVSRVPFISFQLLLILLFSILLILLFTVFSLLCEILHMYWDWHISCSASMGVLRLSKTRGLTMSAVLFQWPEKKWFRNTGKLLVKLSQSHSYFAQKIVIGEISW